MHKNWLIISYIPKFFAVEWNKIIHHIESWTTFNWDRYAT